MNRIERVLKEGAELSRQASLRPGASGLRPGLERIWSRYRWVIIAVLLFVLIDVLVLSGFGSTTGGW